MLVVAAVLVVAFVFARTCQQAQVRVDKDQAVAIAEREVDFTPRTTQIRFLRQGIQREPFWFVSLGVPLGDGPEDGFSELAVIKIDANTGSVESVQEGEAVPPPEGEEVEREPES